MKLKLKIYLKFKAKIKKKKRKKAKGTFQFSNYSAESKYYDDSNTLVVVKMKDELGGVAV